MRDKLFKRREFFPLFYSGRENYRF